MILIEKYIELINFWGYAVGLCIKNITVPVIDVDIDLRITLTSSNPKARGF